MASFTDAFRDGMAAANSIRENFKEVQKVLLHLKDEVFVETGGRVSVRICRLVSQDKLNWNTIEDSEALRKDDIHYHGICADNPSIQDSLIELARWEQDKTGYPCRLLYDNRVVFCENREMLEEGLRDMLRLADNGLKIARLMSKDVSPPPARESSKEPLAGQETPSPPRSEERARRLVRRTKRVRII